MKKVYVLLEWLEVDDCAVHSVYASKELLVKALLETKNSSVYSNALYHWKANRNIIDKTKHDSFESFLMEYIEKAISKNPLCLSDCVYEAEVICE
jgi:hypothetical protein